MGVKVFSIREIFGDVSKAESGFYAKLDQLVNEATPEIINSLISTDPYWLLLQSDRVNQCLIYISELIEKRQDILQKEQIKTLLNLIMKVRIDLINPDVVDKIIMSIVKRAIMVHASRFYKDDARFQDESDFVNFEYSQYLYQVIQILCTNYGLDVSKYHSFISEELYHAAA